MWLEWEILPHFPSRVRVYRELYGQRQSPSHWELESWLIKKTKRTVILPLFAFYIVRFAKGVGLIGSAFFMKLLETWKLSGCGFLWYAGKRKGNYYSDTSFFFCFFFKLWRTIRELFLFFLVTYLLFILRIHFIIRFKKI